MNVRHIAHFALLACFLLQQVPLYAGTFLYSSSAEQQHADRSRSKPKDAGTKNNTPASSPEATTPVESGAANATPAETPAEEVGWDPVSYGSELNKAEILALFVVGAIFSTFVAALGMRLRTRRPRKSLPSIV